MPLLPRVSGPLLTRRFALLGAAASLLPAVGLAAPSQALPAPGDDVCTSPAVPPPSSAAPAVAVDVQLPTALLRTAGGASQSIGQRLRGADAVLLNFIYTSCTTICPPMAQIFAATQEQLGPQAHRVQMVSVSIDPEHDTPRRLRAFAERFGAGPQWSFHTGTTQAVEAVQQAFQVWRPDKMGHTPVTFVKPAGRSQWWRVEGLASPQQLIALALPATTR